MIRYDVLGDVVSAFNILVPVASTPVFRQILASGGPIIYRLGQTIVDLDLVGAISIMSVKSPIVYTAKGLRIWTLGYLLVDDPFAGVALGAFTWDYVDTALASFDWDDADAFFAGTTWDAIDAYDWSTL